MANAKRLLSDVHLDQIKFNSGDRLLVRSSGELQSKQLRSLHRSIYRFAKEDVRILVVDCTRILLTHYVAADSSTTILCSPQDVQISVSPSVVHVGCSVVSVAKNDTFSICVSRMTLEQRSSFRDGVAAWVGPDNEVSVREVSV